MSIDHLFCRGCDRELEMCDWDGDSDRCDSCRDEHEALEWIDATAREVERLAEEHGWCVDDVSHARETRSRYITLERDTGDDGDEDWETLKVRVSDHGTAYCSEDISLAMIPSGDDHTMDDLVRRLTSAGH